MMNPMCIFNSEILNCVRNPPLIHRVVSGSKKLVIYSVLGNVESNPLCHKYGVIDNIDHNDSAELLKDFFNSIYNAIPYSQKMRQNTSLYNKISMISLEIYSDISELTSHQNCHIKLPYTYKIDCIDIMHQMTCSVFPKCTSVQYIV